MKPYYDHGGIVIYHGDCRELLAELSGADLVLTDPPYGIDYNPERTRKTSRRTDGHLFGKSWKKVAGDQSPFDPTPLLAFPQIILWGGNNYTDRLPVGGWLIWEKRTAEGFVSSDAELAWTNTSRLIRSFSLMWDGFRRDTEVNQHFHPTQKPIALMSWCISLVPKASVILDPYMGSGTTLVAAKKFGKSAIGVDTEEEYCETAAKRVNQEVLNFDSEVSTVRQGHFTL